MLCDLRRQLKGVMLYTRRPLAGARAGHFRVRARGSGSDLDQLRDYQPGDDVRYIDWKSSARVQRVVVRDYRDERSRTAHIVCDTSLSMDFGSGRRMIDCAAEVAAAIAIMCENAGDACGLFLASDGLHMRYAPAIGVQQTTRIMSALAENVSVAQRPPATALDAWCADLGAQRLRSSILFVLSDFSGDFGTQLSTYALSLARHHILVAVRIRDASERFPHIVGRQWLLRDSESACSIRLESMGASVQAAGCLTEWRREQEMTLRAAGFLVFDCVVEEPLIGQLCAGLRRCGLMRERIG